MNHTDTKIIVNGLTIRYQTYGDSAKQPLLFFGGLPMKFFSAEANEQIDFNLFKEVFAKYFYLIIADNPGFGESDPPSRIWSFIDYAKFFNAFVKQIGISKPIIMGKSWGGGIALTYAVNFPNDTKALILVNSGINEDADRFFVKFGIAITKFFIKIITSRIVPMSIKKYFISGLLNVPSEKINKNTFNKYLIMEDTIFDFVTEITHRELKIPLILVWGKHDFWAPVKNAYMIHKEVKNSVLLLFEGKHLMMEKRPQEVIEKIIESLKKFDIYL